MINLEKTIYILLQGFAVGAGPCTITCAPILLFYIAGSKRNWQEGLKAVLAFGLTRLVIYSLMGGLVGYVGSYLFQLFYSQYWGKIIWKTAGFFIFFLGLLITAGKKIENQLCRYLQKHFTENNTKTMILLGVVIGLSPCLPLLGVLTEIMFISEHFYQGLLYGFAFGIGTVISPLLLLGAWAPIIRNKLKLDRFFEVMCGVLLILVGIYFISK